MQLPSAVVVALVGLFVCVRGDAVPFAPDDTAIQTMNSMIQLVKRHHAPRTQDALAAEPDKGKAALKQPQAGGGPNKGTTESLPDLGKARPGATASASSEKPQSVPASEAPGARGLANLGNTCFMSSSLQCLASCEPLSSYYLTGAYEHGLNLLNGAASEDNQVSHTFAQLLEEMWADKGATPHPHVSPDKFRRAIISEARQFAGTKQHDAQEFVTELLSYLHEDVNAVSDKVRLPKVWKPDATDSETAQLQWDQDRRTQGRSKIYDVFNGQLRSVVQCECGVRSATFEDSTQLQLKFPHDSRRIIVVRSPQNVTSTTATNIRGETVNSLLLKISRHYNLPKKELVATLWTESGQLVELEPTALIEPKPIKPAPTKPTLDRLIVYRRPSSGEHRFVTFHVEDAQSDDNEVLGLPLLLPVEADFGLENSIMSFLAGFSEGDAKRALEQVEWGDNVVITKNGPLATVHFTKSFLEPAPRDKFASFLAAYLRRGRTIGREPPPSDAPIALEELLRAYVEPETIEYKCDGCPSSGPATKTVTLQRLPSNLIIHLGRFSSAFGFASKIETPVNFPIDHLDMTPYTSDPGGPPAAYELYAVSMHGGSTGGGHYWAITRNYRDGNWYEFNDCRVARVNTAYLRTASTQKGAYLLFYKLKSKGKSSRTY